MNNILIWERKPQPGDEYALMITNPEQVDIKILRQKFSKVKVAKGGRQKHLSTDATQYFEQWLTDVTQCLPGRAYALLSNWFLTEATVDRETPLGDACGDFWDALFAIRPRKRITSVEKNNQINDLSFDAWWKNQQKAQGEVRMMLSVQ